MSNKAQIANIYPLTPMQEGMLFQHLYDPHSEAYYIQMSFELTGWISVSILQQSFQRLVDRHEALRSVFKYDRDKRNLQIVLKERQADFAVVDLSGLDQAEQLRHMEDYRTRERAAGFDLRSDMLIRVTVFRLAEDRHAVLWSHHHILMDGWCVGLLSKEWLDLYEALLHGRDARLGSVPPYSGYVSWLQRQDKEEALSYWRSHLEGYSQAAGIPRRSVQGPSRRCEHVFKLDEKMTQGLNQLAQRHQVTANTVLQALWSVLLLRYSGTADAVFGAVVSGRPPEVDGIERMVGLFINTIPVRVRTEAGQTFGQLIGQMQKEAGESTAYHYFPLYEVQAQSELKRELLNHLFVFENYPVDRELAGKAGASEGHLGERVGHVEVVEQTGYALEIVVSPGTEIEIRMRYDAGVYEEQFIRRIEGHWQQAAGFVIQHPNGQVTDIPILTDAERKAIEQAHLVTEAAYPQERTIVDLFEEQTKQSPGRMAIRGEGMQLTYGELDAAAERVAKVLRAKGVGPEKIVAVMMHRSPAMIVGILGIMKAGGAYLPIDPGLPLERKAYIMADSSALVVLTRNGCGEAAGLNIEELGVESITSGAEPLALEESLGHAENDRPGKASPSNLAYVIYTSGTTGQPKGVMIEHRSLVNRLYWMQNEYRLSESDVILFKTPFTFDVSVWELLWWMMAGASCAVLDSGNEKDPSAVAQAIARYGVSHIHFVPSMLHAFLDESEVSGTAYAASLKQIFASGEELKVAHVEKFNRLLRDTLGVELHNLYGPTEATIDVTAYDTADLAGGSERVPIGRPIANTQIYILDSSRKPVAEGVTGELYIAGDGLARGYLNRPELTAERFVANPLREGRMYRSGDLARWLPDGTIAYAGRADDQIKIRGYRIEPGEIEHRLHEHEAVSGAIVLGEEGELTAYIVLSRETTVQELREHVQASLPAYMTPERFVQVETIPLTANGKADRRALREQGQRLGSAEAAAEPADELESRLAGMFAEVLGHERVGATDDFFALGGHSLKATVLANRLRQQMEAEVTLREVFEHPTVRRMAEAIRRGAKRRESPIPTAAVRDVYPLSSAQKRLYILNKLEEAGTSYNTPGVLELSGRLDAQRLAGAFEALVRRHEVLRTSFIWQDGEPVQRVHEEAKPEFLELAAACESEARTMAASFVKPFRLEEAPLLRAGLIRLSEERHILVFDMHHIVSDGVTLDLLARELGQLYAGVSGEAPRVQYKDYAVWQQARLKSGELARSEAYWLERFAEGVPVLDLPADKPRPAKPSGEGGRVHAEVDEQTLAAVKRLAAESGSTVYMVLLAALQVLLSKLSGQADVVVGTPVAGRTHADTEAMAGVFINMLAMRGKPVGEKPFAAYLQEVREQALGAYEHQEYPFEELVARLEARRDMSRHPLFDVMFVMQNMDGAKLEMGGLRISDYPMEYRRAKLDVMLEASEDAGRLRLMLEYSTDLFREETARKWLRRLNELLQQAGAQPASRISDLQVLLAEEERTLAAFNQTEQLYPKSKTVDELFREQALRTPDRLALTKAGAGMTYRELDQRTEQVALALRRHGVGPGSIVGLLFGHEPEAVVAMLGTMRAGGTYVPLDPEHPAERIAYMVEDSGAMLLLTDCKGGQYAGTAAHTLEELLTRETVDANGEEAAESGLSLIGQEIGEAADRLAYILYTSGTTGKPKGTMVTHQGLTNYICWSEKTYGQGAYPLYTPLTFDLTVTSIFTPLIGGGEVVVYGGADRSHVLLQVLESDEVDVLKLTPAHLKLVPQARKAPERLRALIVGGEQLETEAARSAWAYLGGNVDIYNEYGPTEATVGCMTHRYDPSRDLGAAVPIGVPAANTQIYILDSSRKPVAEGVTGELYIAGDGLARGYLNRPELTAERFVASPLREGRMYRSGDLARWLPDGTIVYAGRADDQIKIRGYRIEPGEIEHRLHEHEAVSGAIVLGEEGELTAYIVLSRETTVQELREHVQASLPGYMTPERFVEVETIPLTANGKADRRALREQGKRLGSAEAAAEPADELESRLAGMFAEVLGHERVGATDDFFALGGHSLKATVLANRLRQQMEAEVTLREVFEHPTVRRMAEAIRRGAKRRESPIPTAAVRDVYPLSSAQKRLYILNKLEEEGTSYNTPGVLELSGRLDAQRLAGAFEALVQRHEVLRTSFIWQDGEPAQRIHEEAKPEFLEFAAADESEARAVAASFVKPFRLEEAPLLRAGLIRLSEERHILVFDMHHIVSDGVTLDLLARELGQLYAGVSGEAPRVQYKDYAVWQQERLKSGELARSEAYWLERFAEGVPVLDLPGDKPRPAKPSGEGGRVHAEVDEQTLAAVKQLAAESGSTVYMVLLAALQVLLSKLSGQADVVVGTPVAGRTHADTEAMAGVFINMLAMRGKPAGEKSFAAYLQEVREQALGAYEHQEYPFEELVARLEAKRDMSRHPLFDVMFVMQNMDGAKLEMGGIRISDYQMEHRRAKLDVMLGASEEDGRLRLMLEYSTDLFREETARKWLQRLNELLQQAGAQPASRISDLQVLLAEEERTLAAFNQTEQPYPKSKTVDELFREQALRTPDRPALTKAGAVAGLTYRELDQRTAQVAQALRRHGVGPGSIVGLLFGHEPEAVVAILGTMRAGGTYVPLDPEHPAERTAYMVEDSGAMLLLTDRSGGQYAGTAAYTLEELLARKAGSVACRVEQDVVEAADRLAYILYTSGTTGKPKGTMVTHQGLTNYICWSEKTYGQGAYPLYTPFTFDLTVTSIFTPLIGGGEVVVYGGADRSHVLLQVLESDEVDVLKLTPAHLKLVPQARKAPERLRALIVGGEQLETEAARSAWAYLGGNVDIYNEYGPTEATVGCMTHRYDPSRDLGAAVPIGVPAANTQIYILDSSRKPVAEGVTGELYIAGDGLARGYLNRPELTAERFVASPLREGRMYRSGDLARWLPDGTIAYAGRADDQIKIRGYRIEPGEIEHRLHEHEAVSGAIVLGEDGELTAYIVLLCETTVQELREHVQASLPGYMTPERFVQVETIPLTANGKADRRALREQGKRLGSAEAAAEPADELESRLAGMFAEVLGHERVGATDDFFALGGHSLKATALANRLRQQMEAEVTLREVFEHPTVRGMAEAIRRGAKRRESPIPTAAVRDVYPLSSAQKRLYILNKLEEEGTSYNTPGVLELSGRLDAKRLEGAFEVLVQRHEVLRTSFIWQDGEPAQRIHEEAKPEFLELAAADESEARAMATSFVKPFRLEEAPLLRAGLIRLSEERHILVFDMHHIVSDGVTLDLLARELGQLYAGVSGEAPRVQYKDYAVWQQARLQSGELARSEAYWLEQFAEGVPVLDLPADKPRPAKPSGEGGRVHAEVDEQTLAAVKQLAAESGSTVYMVLLAALQVLLSKLSGQADVVVGTPVAGRTHADTEAMAGVFINMLAMRGKPAGEKPFAAYLQEVREQALGAYEHQEYPFEELVSRLEARQDMSRHPLFDVMFVLHGQRKLERRFHDVSINDSYEVTGAHAKFDLMLEAVEQEGSYMLSLAYRTALYLESTAAEWLKDYMSLLELAAAVPSATLDQLWVSLNDLKYDMAGVKENMELAFRHHFTF
ncbi:amino acid adenylation domain-containing protein [Paenibacillus phyllosphaerae]|uniref:Amino acid adenylation domain-containing protein n=1 Tax=Paenibacillus phyllosphaerae TaxID=274593 RepID=A0A7W5B3I2_9BACL|nr:non-ribosomal peptide synthetase [Paenibacillus phyllosphaerae]MBB3113016.1 amino acid adenylation domain-containing protein [Paenibacillus phyllosphaerae]